MEMGDQLMGGGVGIEGNKITRKQKARIGNRNN